MSTLWQYSNCFESWYWTLTTAATEGVRGRGCHQEDGELSNRQSENSGGASCHPFVCSQAVFSPVKTKFNLPSFHLLFFSPLYITPPFPPKLFSASITLFFSLSGFVFLTTLSATSATHAHKRLYSILLAPGVVVWVNIVWNSFSFKSVITTGIVPNAFSFLPTPIRSVRERNKVHVATI